MHVTGIKLILHLCACTLTVLTGLGKLCVRILKHHLHGLFPWMLYGLSLINVTSFVSEKAMD